MHSIIIIIITVAGILARLISIQGLLIPWAYMDPINHWNIRQLYLRTLLCYSQSLVKAKIYVNNSEPIFCKVCPVQAVICLSALKKQKQQWIIEPMSSQTSRLPQCVHNE